MNNSSDEFQLRNQVIELYIKLSFLAKENVKKTICDVTDIPSESLKMAVRGRSLESGLPESIQLTAIDTKRALDESVIDIINTVVETLDSTPPELSGDIMVDGIVLAAAGLKRLGWDNRITEIIGPEILLPAIGQGAVGIEARDIDVDILRMRAYVYIYLDCSGYKKIYI